MSKEDIDNTNSTRIFCKYCGSILQIGLDFCPYCGELVQDIGPSEPPAGVTEEYHMPPTPDPAPDTQGVDGTAEMYSAPGSIPQEPISRDEVIAPKSTGGPFRFPKLDRLPIMIAGAVCALIVALLAFFNPSGAGTPTLSSPATSAAGVTGTEATGATSSSSTSSNASKPSNNSSSNQANTSGAPKKTSTSSTSSAATPQKTSASSSSTGATPQKTSTTRVSTGTTPSASQASNGSSAPTNTNTAAPSGSSTQTTNSPAGSTSESAGIMEAENNSASEIGTSLPSSSSSAPASSTPSSSQNSSGASSAPSSSTTNSSASSTTSSTSSGSSNSAEPSTSTEPTSSTSSTTSTRSTSSSTTSTSSSSVSSSVSTSSSSASSSAVLTVNNTESGSSLFNVSDGNRVVSDSAQGADIYYIAYGDQHSIRKCKKDGSGDTELYRFGQATGGTNLSGTIQIQNLFSCNGILVFAEFSFDSKEFNVVVYDVSANSGKVVQHGTASGLTCIQVVGNSIYYADGDKLYAMDLNGENATQKCGGMSGSVGWIIDDQTLYRWDASVTAVNLSNAETRVVYETSGSIIKFVPYGGRYYAIEHTNGTADDLAAVPEDRSGSLTSASTDITSMPVQRVVAFDEGGANRTVYFAMHSNVDFRFVAMNMSPQGEFLCLEAVYGDAALLRSCALDGTNRKKVEVDPSAAAGYPRETGGMGAQCKPYVIWTEVIDGRMYTIPTTYSSGSQHAFVSMDLSGGDARVLSVG